MFESGPASAVSCASSATEMMGRGMPNKRVLRPIALQALTNAEIKGMLPWGSFPRRHRRFFVAQNGRCPYCGLPLKLVRSLEFGANVSASTADAPSTEHVFPRWLGGTLHIGNKVVAHALCNKIKGAREPYPCEILFARITGDIVIAMLPPADVSNYLQSHRTSQKEPASVERI